MKEKIVLSPYFSSICFLDLGNICGKLVESIGFKEKKIPPSLKIICPNLDRVEWGNLTKKAKRREKETDWKSSETILDNWDKNQGCFNKGPC